MSSTNRVAPFSLAQIITLSLAAALLLGLAVNASAGTGVLDSVKEFFGMAAVEAASGTLAPEPAPLVAAGTCDLGNNIEVEATGGPKLSNSACLMGKAVVRSCGNSPANRYMVRIRSSISDQFCNLRNSEGAPFTCCRLRGGSAYCGK